MANPMPALRALLDDHKNRYGCGDIWRAANEEMEKVEIGIMIYKIEALGDTLYVQSDSEAGAIQKLTEMTGTIPRSLLTISTVAELPDGEEFLG